MSNKRVLMILFLLAAAVGVVLAQKTEQTGLTATLTGAAEVPGPGDPDGAGTFKATFNPDKGQICYELSVSNIGAPKGAHIHTGGPTEAGPVLVTLKTPVDGMSKDCVSVEKMKLEELMKDPAKYYVNVHNEEYADGAVRGQLSK